MKNQKLPIQRKFENEVQRESDRLDELKANKIGISIILFILSCLSLSLCQ